MPIIKDIMFASEGELYSVWKRFTDEEGEKITGGIKVFSSESILDCKDKAEELCAEYGFDGYLCAKLKVDEQKYLP